MIGIEIAAFVTGSVTQEVSEDGTLIQRLAVPPGMSIKPVFLGASEWSAEEKDRALYSATAQILELVLAKVRKELTDRGGKVVGTVEETPPAGRA